ncbi:type III-B CRISPR module RAMP protein Cmr1 [Thermus caliditerrae]|uniref:type III-B CRISPR module RAMP protein Cmr1 n=1 Tax=Thermus caliditerrae TaxID=1330700 RepID=UPI001F47F744|nr:type III-B CRISPR module RAMP protein Cmr1 [Thermus caliditerrae]
MLSYKRRSMPRRISLRAPDFDISTPPKWEEWELKLATITPMFGGGAIPGQADARRPIRPSSLRGHLRFWWRATEGAGFRTPEELFLAEEAVWGSTERPSRVILRVEAQDAAGETTPSRLVPKVKPSSGPRERFFLFPFEARPSENKGQDAGFERVSFTLRIIHNLSVEEAEALRRAIRAWVAFGGVGARTRRGLGALEVEEDKEEWLPQSPGHLREWFAHPAQESSHTTLAGAIIRLGPAARGHGGLPKGHEAWRSLGEFWARFRKGHFPSEYRPTGPTAWQDHKVLLGLKPGHPRVSLVKPFYGLPIVYQAFKGKRTFAGTLEALHPRGKRMASPVILKPIAFADGTIRPAVVFLKTPPPQRIRITKQESPHAWELDLSFPGPAEEEVLVSLGAQNPLEALMRAAELAGFTEEIRL